MREEAIENSGSAFLRINSAYRDLKRPNSANVFLKQRFCSRLISQTNCFDVAWIFDRCFCPLFPSVLKAAKAQFGVALKPVKPMAGVPSERLHRSCTQGKILSERSPFAHFGRRMQDSTHYIGLGCLR